jgi:sarcosine oxidase, subunit alpha
VGALEFDGQQVELHEGDTVASAVYRSGVRTFTRSLKYHRRRGLYCMSGDCPNCMVTVDGDPGVRACMCAARDGQRVARESGWPSTERDLLHITDRLHRLMPVGFYYKTFIRPRFAWEAAEKIIRRATGVGSLPAGRAPEVKPSRHMRIDVLVVGAGVAGIAAAKTAASTGSLVLLVDEGRIGDGVAQGPTRDRLLTLATEMAMEGGVALREHHTALGVYEGPLVPIVGANELLEVEPTRIVVATGAVEHHGVFPGNDLPGVWLGRGAARMAGVHGVRIGERAVVIARTEEGMHHAATLVASGSEVVVATSAELASLAPSAALVLSDVEIVKAEGTRHIDGVVLRGPDGERHLPCDALVLSLGLARRDALVRMADLEPVVAAGDAARPGCSLEEAELTGAAAGAGDAVEVAEGPDPRRGDAGYVCLCEDVAVKDLEQAWDEGWTSSEIVKRYTTATMGPCQAALCGRHLACFAKDHGASSVAGARTTARPPARPVALEDLIGGVHEVVDKRTALHELHVASGARVDRSGAWMRPATYGDAAAEYRAVREAVGLMDVGTLGKFLIAGRDASTLVDRVFPCRTDDIAAGRSRYLLALSEAGYVMDDGMLCALEDRRWYVTTTSGGADGMEAWLREWTDRWGLHVHLVNHTAMLGAILVAGPRARDLLARLTADAVGADALPHMRHADITVAGVSCRALRVGFVGEVSFELHHPRSRGPELWDALLEAGAELGVKPFGLDALDALRLEKGHVYLAQDTMPDDHPLKLGLGFAVAMDKPSFVGKPALQRMAALPLERKLVGLSFDGPPQRGAPLRLGEQIVGRVTSCATSGVIGTAVGLGWLRAVGGEFPGELDAGDITARVVPTPFYDPDGARLRA